MLRVLATSSGLLLLLLLLQTAHGSSGSSSGSGSRMVVHDAGHCVDATTGIIILLRTK